MTLHSRQTLIGQVVALILVSFIADLSLAQGNRERLVWATPMPAGKLVRPIGFTPDGKQLLVLTQDTRGAIGDEGSLALWETATGKESLALQGKPKILVSSWNISADGQRLVLGTGDCLPVRKGAIGPVDVSLRVWDLTTGMELPALAGHTAPIYACALSPDGKTAVSCSSGFIDGGKPHPDLTIRVWDTTTGKELRRLKGEPQPVYAAAFTPDGKQIVTASPVAKLVNGERPSTLRVWDSASGQMVRSFTGPEVRQGSRSFFLPKNDQLALTSKRDSDGMVSILNYRTGQKLNSTFIPYGDGHAVSGDGRYAISAYTGPVAVGNLTIKDAPIVTVWDVQKSTPKGAVAALQFFKGIENTPAWLEIAQKRCGATMLTPDGRNAIVVNGDRLLMFVLP